MRVYMWCICYQSNIAIGVFALPLMSLIQAGCTALYVARYGGHNDTVQLLLDNGASVDKPNKVGWLAVHVI